MEISPRQIRAPLGFTRPEDVFDDHERRGMLRARAVALNADPTEVFDYRLCVLNDLTAPETRELNLEDAGFQTIDLSGNEGVQRALARVRDDDRMSDGAADALRASLQGAHLPLGQGRSLRVEHVAEEGLILRRAGPNGLDVNPGGMKGANGHGGAPAIHADQDVFGTPLRQMMKGEAPTLFRHQTPDGRNDDSSLFLLNLWIPIQQITRPLVLMDRRSLDQKRHQLRYGLPVTTFLDRNEATKVNDIWAFLPDPNQEWYFRSTMGPDQAYVFDTLGEAHGACILPGEEALERLYLELDRAGQAVRAADADALRRITSATAPEIPEVTTAAISDAWHGMTTLRAEAGDRADEICAAGASGNDWCRRARTAMDATIRKSVELRMVATLVSA